MKQKDSRNSQQRKARAARSCQSQLCEGDCRWSSALRFLAAGSTMKQLFPCLRSAIPPSLSVCFLVACSIYFNVYLCAKPVSEWLDTPLICGLQGGGRSAAYSHDIRRLCRAKKTFSGTPNPWAPSKYHNLSAQLTWATWDTWEL